MLETIISSRIRRALVEYIVTHPVDRFYLRGLAKMLELPVSPLRRELKRLEQAGVLTAAPEGNILFYTVNTSCPQFIQLQHASETAPAPSIIGLEAHRAEPQTAPAPIPVPRPSVWSSPLATPVLIGAAGVGTALILVVAGLAYLHFGQQQFLFETSRTLRAKSGDVTVVVPSTASTSGAMHGSRWRIVPGGFGGFSSGDRHESY